jgi:hypothetical protein
MVPETQIDLHQHTQEQARRLLDGFLHASQGERLSPRADGRATARSMSCCDG